MGTLRRFGRGLARVAAAALLALVVVLVPAAVLDRSPTGSIRATLFPAAVAAFDPFLWNCARNSLVNAAIVTIGSLILGVGLARVTTRWRFWGRGPLAAACFAPVVVPTACTALGLRLLFGPSGPWHGAWLQLAAQVGLDPHAWAWIALVWVGVASGVPLVALATAQALVRVEPAWEHAAHLAGAGRWQVWRRVVRPMVRAEIARAVGIVFGLTLVEPAAPLLLGLRRTLAFQTVEAALSPSPAPRAAVLAMAAMGYAVIAHLLIHWWGGEPAPLADRPVGRPELAGHWRALAFALILGGASLLLWLPGLGVCGAALTPAPSDSVGGMRLTLAPLANLARYEEIGRLVLHSLVLGAGVLAFDLLLARALRQRKGRAFLAQWPEAVPPLVLGVGALMLPEVFQMAAGLVGGPSQGALRTAADALDPYRTPGVLLFAAVAASALPSLARRAITEPSAPRDAALQLGLSGARARRLAVDRCWRERFGPLILTFTLAATNVAPALVLVPTGASRTITPGLLILADQPGDGLHRAAALAACLIISNVLALGLAEPRPR